MDTSSLTNDENIKHIGMGLAAAVTLYAVYKCCCRRKPNPEENKTGEVNKSTTKVASVHLTGAKSTTGGGRQQDEFGGCISTVPMYVVCPPRKRNPISLNPDTVHPDPHMPEVTSAAAAYIHDRYYRGPSSNMPRPGEAFIRSPFT